MKKLFVCVLCILLLASCVIGCSNDNDPEIVGKWYNLYHSSVDQGCVIHYDELVIQDKEVYYADFYICIQEGEAEVRDFQEDKEYGNYEKIERPKFELINATTLEYKGREYSRMSSVAEMNNENFNKIIRFFEKAAQGECLTLTKLKEKSDAILFDAFKNGESVCFECDDEEISFELRCNNYNNMANSERYYGVVSEHRELFDDYKKYGAWMPVLGVIVKTDLDFMGFNINAAHLLNYLYVTEDGIIKSNV